MAKSIKKESLSKENNNIPKRESLSDALNKYSEKKTKTTKNEESDNVVSSKIPDSPINSKNFHENDIETTLTKETDPDLMIAYESIELPSKGHFYSHGISEVDVEYMTSRDEDLLTTPSLIENGTVLDILLKRKIKTKNIEPSKLLSGDRSAIILFLRTSSYGTDYTVEVTDPRNGNVFESVVDLSKLKYKEITELPDENGYFSVELPMRKKLVKFKLLNVGEDKEVFNKSESIKEAYGDEHNQYNTLKIKSQIISIDGKTDKTYISKFVDAMPALDSYTIRRKILDVNPDVDMEYEFKTNDGHKFKSRLTLGIDFFFPNT